MQLSLTPRLQGWGLPFRLHEGEPHLGPQTAGSQVYTSFRALQPPVSGQSGGAGGLVRVGRAAARSFLCEVQSNWAARLGDGSPDRDPFPALQLHSPSEFYLATYMGLLTLGFRGQQATPPKGFWPRLQRDQRVQVVLKSCQLPGCR